MNEAAAAEISRGDRVIITVAVFVMTFMQGANVSIPNAALSYMQGTMSMADDEIGWLFTSYLVASVLAIPLAPWLAGRFGRRLMVQMAMAIFTLGLILDARATSPIPIVIARIIQGAGGGTAVPLSMVILLDLFPAGRAWISLSLSACVLFGISAGPCIGGWLSEYYGWRSIFYVSMPMAAFIFMAATLSLPEKKAEQKRPFDFFGFAAFALGVTGLQMLLDRGERLEWFASKEIWAEALVSAFGFYTFAVHILTAKTHFFDKGLLKDRNFVLSTIMYFAVGFVLLPTLALTSPMLNELLNYPVPTTGYMTIPRGITLVGTLLLMGFVPARIDNRILIVGGVAIVVYAHWRMLGYSPAMDWRAVAIALLLQGVGVGVLISALTKTAFATLDQKLRPEGAAIFNLSRLYGGTIGIAVVQLCFYSNTQAMHMALAKGLAPYHAAAHLSRTLTKPGLAMLNDLTTGQAALVGILGQFKVLLIAILIVSPLALFLRKPQPQLKLAEAMK